METERKVDNNSDAFLESIKELPSWVEAYKLNHWSPSQLTSSDDMWGYKYLYLTQEQRRKLPGNSKMFAGVCLGDMAIAKFANFLWMNEVGKGLVKKELPPERKIFEKVLDKFNLYEPVNEKDAEDYAVIKKGLAIAFETLKKGIRSIELSNPVECERCVSMYLDGCTIPTIGRIDMEDSDNIIEMKTKWRRRGRPRKDGTCNYALPKLQEDYLGFEDHLSQLAFYYFANNEKKKPHLFVMHEEDYKVFTPENCEELKPENLKKHLHRLTLVAQRRERLLNNHQGKDTWYQDVVPNFKHFFWQGMGEHKEIAMKLWGLT